MSQRCCEVFRPNRSIAMLRCFLAVLVVFVGCFLPVTRETTQPRVRRSGRRRSTKRRTRTGASEASGMRTTCSPRPRRVRRRSRPRPLSRYAFATNTHKLHAHTGFLNRPESNRRTGVQQTQIRYSFPRHGFILPASSPLHTFLWFGAGSFAGLQEAARGQAQYASQPAHLGCR